MSPKNFGAATSRILLISFVLVVGLFVLAGYFFPIPALIYIRTVLLNLAVILSGFAILVGVANLISVHLKKISRKQKGSAYSILLVISLVVTFLLGLAGHYIPFIQSWFNSAFNYIQLPVEATLMGILAITLTYACVRLLRRRLNLLTIVFLATFLLILLGTASLPFLGTVPGISNFLRPLVDRVFATAGARGLLLGVALGTLATGLRVLFGTDRPYGVR